RDSKSSWPLVCPAAVFPSLSSRSLTMLCWCSHAWLAGPRTTPHAPDVRRWGAGPPGDIRNANCSQIPAERLEHSGTLRPPWRRQSFDQAAKVARSRFLPTPPVHCPHGSAPCAPASHHSPPPPRPVETDWKNLAGEWH